MHVIELKTQFVKYLDRQSDDNSFTVGYVRTENGYSTSYCTCRYMYYVGLHINRNTGMLKFRELIRFSKRWNRNKTIPRVF